MKKTLILALASASAGIACAQDTVIFAGAWTSNGPAADNTPLSDQSQPFLYEEGNDYAVIGKVSNTTYNPWANITGGSDSFTFSFDLKNVDVTVQNSQWCDIFSLKLSNGSKLQLQINQVTKKLSLYNADADGNQQTDAQIIDTTLTLDSFSDWKTFSLVADADAGKLSIYLDGVLVSSTADSTWTGSSVSGLQFGSEYAGTRKLGGSMEINNITLTNGAVYPTPEPTTATLSLLALAGLCARRRRK